MTDEELKNYLDKKFAEQTDRMRDNFAEQTDRMREKLAEQTEQMREKFAEQTEQMRDMQTELLRGFEAFSAGQAIRLRKLEADQSNLDTALSSRVNIVEARLTQIELRLAKP